MVSARGRGKAVRLRGFPFIPSTPHIRTPHSFLLYDHNAGRRARVGTGTPTERQTRENQAAEGNAGAQGSGVFLCILFTSLYVHAEMMRFVVHIIKGVPRIGDILLLPFQQQIAQPE